MYRPLLRFWRYVFLTPVLGVFGLSILWALGLVSFIITVMAISPTSLATKTDGIVVLTGGADRVRTGLELLQAHQGRELLISGVHKAADLRDLLLKAHMADQDFPCCITLGFEAVDTAGNARETAAWASDHHLTALRLVTANYHMPRAYLEMKRAMPDIKVIAHPVRSSRFDLWTPDGAKLVLEEYHKTMLVAGRWALRQIRETLNLQT